MKVVYSNELYHHGIKGQKWGIRRFQNKDGSYTAEGKERRSMSTNPSSKKKVAIALGSVAVGVALAAYASNPAIRKTAKLVVAKAASKTVGSVVAKHPKTIKIGKQIAEATLKGIKEGAVEGLKELPRKATKAVVIGVGMNAAKRALDKVVGKEEAARIFKANNPKKIDSFWRVNSDEDDEKRR